MAAQQCGVTSAYDRASSIAVGLLIFACFLWGSELLRNLPFLGLYYDFRVVTDRTDAQSAIYYDAGRGLSEAQKVELKCRDLGDRQSCVGTAILSREIIGLRFDPSVRPSRLRLVDIEISSNAGRAVTLSNGGISLASPNNQLVVEPMGGEYSLTSSGSDPFVFLVAAGQGGLGAALATTGMKAPLGDILQPPTLIAVALTILAQILLLLAFRLSTGSHIAALATVAASFVAWICLATPENFSPDEQLHLKALAYYAKGALFPPQIGSSEALPYESPHHAFSYLYLLDPVYPLYGLVGAVLRTPADHMVLLGRGLNFTLLVGGFALLLRYRKVLGTAAVLLAISIPQVLYLFSYFNGDAFGLFTSVAALLFALLWAQNRTPLPGPTHTRLALVFGVIYGLAILSKSFYVVPVLSVACIFLWLVGRSLRRDDRQVERSALLTFFIAASAVVAARLAVDVVTYGVHDICATGVGKCQALRDYQAAHAQMASYGKPASATALFHVLTDSEWLSSSLRSFMIGFGYMQFFAPPEYYTIASAFWLVACAALLWFLVRAGEIATALKAALILLMGVVAAPLGLSALYSATYDYQPQGRYLFGGVAIALALVVWLRPRLEAVVVSPGAFFACTSFVLFNLATATNVLRERVW